MEDENKTYSIALRLRRVIHEDVYVTVFVDEKIVKENEDGTHGIDWDKFVAEGIRTSQQAGADWQVESMSTEVHPIQQPKPAHRTSIDSQRDKD